jgi:integrase
MPRKIKSAIDNRTSRRSLRIQGKPHWTKLLRGVFIGYRKNKTAPHSWVVRGTNGDGSYWTETLTGVPDDFEAADGGTVLDYDQACTMVRAMARGQGDDTGQPVSVGAALDRYEADLKTRGGCTINASRVRNHLPQALLNKSIQLLTAAEIRKWRDDLLTQGLKPATVRRTAAAFKAALNLAANLDPKRITDRSAWDVGLSGIKQTSAEVSRVISDGDVVSIVNCAYALDPAFGLFIDVLASTGTRTSQAINLLVGDLQNGGAPRLMMPSSRKGGKNRKSIRRPVPITPTLAGKLKAAAGDRSSDEPLLTRTDGTAWPANGMELWRLFTQVAEWLGIQQTAYCLRHSSIVRSLLAGTPTRVVAANHDTSTVQLERVYSHFIGDHADAISRRGLIDTTAPVPDANIVTLAGRR